MERVDTYDRINIRVFNYIQHIISGWPGGKPNADDSTRPVSSTPFPKRVIIFSPHPDDDVISMGGTFNRLIEHGHDVHVAYQTSGNVAVYDDVVLQNIDTAKEMGFGDAFDEIREVIANKKNPALWGLRVNLLGDILIKDANGNERTVAAGGVIPIVKGLKIKFNENTIGEIR